MAKIYAPNKQYTGISAGVNFVNGIGECTDPYLISWFETKGYIVEKESVIVETPKPKPETKTKPEHEEDSKPKPKTTRKKV